MFEIPRLEIEAVEMAANTQPQWVASQSGDQKYFCGWDKLFLTEASPPHRRGDGAWTPAKRLNSWQSTLALAFA